MKHSNPRMVKAYNSERWKRTRKLFRDSKQNLCEQCMKEGRDFIAGEEVHHKQDPQSGPDTIDEVAFFDWNNLMLLCARCHRRFHGREGEYDRGIDAATGYPTDPRHPWNTAVDFTRPRPKPYPLQIRTRSRPNNSK